jgi:hypothetical protein
LAIEPQADPSRPSAPELALRADDPQVLVSHVVVDLD